MTAWVESGHYHSHLEKNGWAKAGWKPSAMASSRSSSQLRTRLVDVKCIFRVLVVTVMVGVAAPVLACLPLPREAYARTEARVRARFDNVDSVVVVTLLDARKVRFNSLGIDLEGEKATFRVDRIFKGRSRVGDRLILFSYSTCARSVVEWDGPDGPVKLSRRWLSYRNESDKTEITYSDMTRPINFATYDLKVLPRIARARTNKNPP